MDHEGVGHIHYGFYGPLCPSILIFGPDAREGLMLTLGGTVCLEVRGRKYPHCHYDNA